MAKHEFETLDAMRAVAALAVVTHHAPGLFGTGLLPNSPLAVDLFFALSGFVIAHAYEQRLAGGLGFWRFMAIRVVRLYPLYLLGLIAGVVQVMAQGPRSGLSVFCALGVLMIPNPGFTGVRDLYPLDIPAWSLAYELAINAVYAAFLPVLRSTRALAAVFAGAASMLLAMGFYHGNLDFGFYWSQVPAGVVRVATGFGAGLIVYRCRDRLPSFRVTPWLLLALEMMLFWLHPAGWSAVLYQWSCIAILFPLLVWAGANVRLPRRVAPALCRLGAASYAVYVLHMPLLRLIQSGITGLPVPAVGLALMACLFVLGIVLDETYDTPLRSWLSRMLNVRVAAASTSP